MKIKQVATLVVCMLFGAIIAGCGGDDDKGGKDKSGKAGANLTGDIAIEGSSTVQPISLKAKEKFNGDFANVNITVGGNGSGNGFKALAKKECDVSDASRPIKKKELDACEAAGVEFIEVPVAYDGLTIAVNKENDFVDQLTIDQLMMIFRKDKAVKKWSEVKEGWPEEEIKVFAPGDASGTYDYFLEVIDKKEESGMREDQISTNEDDKILVQGVKGNKFAIGFFGYAYYESNKDDLKAVAIVNPKTSKAVAPSMATIEDSSYAPFSRPLFIYVNTNSYKKTEVQKFVDFYLDNAREIVEEAKYVALPDSVYDKARSNLEQGNTGTHYVDDNGEKRSGSLLDVYKEANRMKK